MYSDSMLFPGSLFQMWPSCSWVGCVCVCVCANHFREKIKRWSVMSFQFKRNWIRAEMWLHFDALPFFQLLCLYSKMLKVKWTEIKLETNPYLLFILLHLYIDSLEAVQCVVSAECAVTAELMADTYHQECVKHTISNFSSHLFIHCSKAFISYFLSPPSLLFFHSSFPVFISDIFLQFYKEAELQNPM